MPRLLRAWPSTTRAPTRLATAMASSQTEAASAKRARSISACPRPARAWARAADGVCGTSRTASW